MKERKGIVLAGGAGTRLHPATLGISKQLLPVYDKPMIYYPLSVLMLAGIRNIAVITTPEDQQQFKRLLGNGSNWGCQLTYLTQPKPEGLAQAFTIAEEFLDGAPSTLVLGDNIFFGHDLPVKLASASSRKSGGTIFGYHVADPERYGVLGFDKDGKLDSIVEKPEKPASEYAVTGLYFLDHRASDMARKVKRSRRGEYEITSLLELYLGEGGLNVELLGRGFAWLDTGTHDSLLDAGNFVRTLQKRQGVQVGCLEEIAHSQGWINDEDLSRQAKLLGKSVYGAYLKRLAAKY